MNECIDSTMGHIHVCFAVLLASDDPRTSWSFQLNLTMIRSLPLSSDNYNLLVLLLVLSKYWHEGSGAQLASYLGLDIINNVCEVRDSLNRMTDDFRIRNASLANHTLTRLVILFCSQRIP